MRPDGDTHGAERERGLEREYARTTETWGGAPEDEEEEEEEEEATKRVMGVPKWGGAAMRVKPLGP